MVCASDQIGNGYCPQDNKERGRLNLLLSYAGWREQNWAEQLPRLLNTMGVSTIQVGSGKQATDVLSTQNVHIAIVDLGLPIEDTDNNYNNNTILNTYPNTGGTRLLQLLRRLNNPPPTVVVRRPANTQRADMRLMQEALREGAFAVIDAPVKLEMLLEIMRRILKRYYSNMWPGN